MRDSGVYGETRRHWNKQVRGHGAEGCNVAVQKKRHQGTPITPSVDHTSAAIQSSIDNLTRDRPVTPSNRSNPTVPGTHLGAEIQIGTSQRYVYSPFVSMFLVSVSGILNYITFGSITVAARFAPSLKLIAVRYTCLPGYPYPASHIWSDIAVYPIAD